MLVGLLLVRAGYQKADSIAALFVACIVLLAAVRLMRGNVDVLMDRVPADAEAGGAGCDRATSRPRSSCGGCGCGRPPGR